MNRPSLQDGVIRPNNNNNNNSNNNNNNNNNNNSYSYSNNAYPTNRNGSSGGSVGRMEQSEYSLSGRGERMTLDSLLHCVESACGLLKTLKNEEDAQKSAQQKNQQSHNNSNDDNNPHHHHHNNNNNNNQSQHQLYYSRNRKIISQHALRRQSVLDCLWKDMRAWLQKFNYKNSNSSSPNSWDDNWTETNDRARTDYIDGISRTSEKDGSTSLLLVCKLPDPPEDIVSALVEAEPQMVYWSDSNGWLPLHHAVASGASLEILQLLVNVDPETTCIQDKLLRTPLHFCFSRSDIIMSQMNNPSRNTKQADVAQSNIIHTLADHGAVTISDVNGMLPLHYACAYGTTASVVQVLVEAYPQSIHVLDTKFGRTPIHFLMVNAKKPLAPIVLQFLVQYYILSPPIHLPTTPTNNNDTNNNSDTNSNHNNNSNHHHTNNSNNNNTTMTNTNHDSNQTNNNNNNHSNNNKEYCHILNVTDRDGHLPLHLLSNESYTLVNSHKNERTNATKCLKIYLNTKPKVTADFLTALQSLPVWLRDHAVTVPHVQDLLDDKISQQFPTSIMLLDGILLLVIIICFELSSKISIDMRFHQTTNNNNNTTTTTTTATYPSHANDEYVRTYVIAMLTAITYFLLREIGQVASLISLGIFRSWLRDPTNLVDMLILFLVYFFAIDMFHQANLDYGITIDLETFRSGCAITKSALWVGMIFYLKSTNVDFAVFVETVSHVSNNLKFFIMALCIFLLAFAEMFYIVYAETPLCTSECAVDGEAPFPHCNMGTSFLKVYSMMMGEIGDESRYQGSLTAQIIYIAYAFLVVILLSNVLIAIVTDSYSVIKNERASMVFWSNRLDFVAEMEVLASTLHKLLRRFHKPNHNNNNNHDNNNTNNNNNNNNNSNNSNKSNNKPRSRSNSHDMYSSLLRDRQRRDGDDDLNHTSGSSGNNVNGEDLDETDDTSISDEHVNLNNADGKTTTTNPPSSLSSSSSSSWWGQFVRGTSFQRGWKKLCEQLFASTDEYDISPEFLSFCLVFLVRIFVALVLIPCWLVLGFATMGWLWPPQVRQFIWKRRTAVSRADLAGEVLNEVHQLKREVHNLRADFNKGERGKKELAALKSEVDSIKMEVTSDLQQVKDIMKTLLELGRQSMETRDMALSNS